jgi:predicted Zn-dependent protease
MTGPQGRSIEDVALGSMERAGLRPINGRQTVINGVDSFVGTYQGSLQGAGRVMVRAAHIKHEQNVFLIAGIAPPDSFDRTDPSFETSINSFRPLTRAEAEAIRPNTITLYTARAGDTWEAIAERVGKNIVKPTTLAIMNGHAVRDQPKPGERLKIVVAG